MNNVSYNELSPRARLRRVLEDLVADHPEMSTADLAELVGRTLPEQDAQLVEEFLAAEAHQILAMELRMHFQQNRAGIFGTLDIHGRQPGVPLAQRSERVKNTLYERIEAWREYDPLAHRSRPLLDMNRRSLLESANFDMGRAFHFGFKGLLKQRMAEGMPDDDTPASSVFSAEQIVELSQKVRSDMARGSFRLRLQPMRPLTERSLLRGDLRDEVEPVDALPGAPELPRQADGRRAQKPRDRRGLDPQ